MVKETYIVRFTPKYKNSGYKSFDLKPAQTNVVWSKTRAIKERNFLKETGRNAYSHVLVSETHNSRILKRKWGKDK